MAEAKRVGRHHRVRAPRRRFRRTGRSAVPAARRRREQNHDRKLRGQVAFGPERTIEQDSTFAFRVIVDIAIKALSPAINDPTTAVLAIDQLQRLLRTVGNRDLHDERIFDSDGRLRVIFRTPNWDGFCATRLQRDPPVRCEKSPGRAAPARDDRKPVANPARVSPPRVAPGAGPARPHFERILSICRRLGACPHSGLARAGRGVGAVIRRTPASTGSSKLGGVPKEGSRRANTAWGPELG